ncbi:MAG: thioredoxin domain-containing protein [Elusimicrobia bacterium]|nr:thioredoxin domain-containing protein [Elusimicrobiota bacterium]
MNAAPGKANRLAGEKSPYLLQHAFNPVDWYPWGQEAFDRAGKEDKPILLSIGYSTCHWCHVMERESFSNAAIAQLLNRDFIAIKVDREERPDIDKVYMTAVQALTGQGGWPLNVFLTPALEPFYGGTYFPPVSRWGAPAFSMVLSRIADLWRTRREELLSDAGKLAQALKAYARGRDSAKPPQSSWLDRAFEAFQVNFDADSGGFGGAPKFPMPVNQGFLLRYWARTRKKEALELVLRTLKGMAAGGIRDHLGGGFHRYSVDGGWRVPHFEKMLYDNAQLAVNYVEAFQATREPWLAAVARGTLDYVLRDLRHAEGGFLSAEDADSLPAGDPGGEKAEGAFYLWTETEFRELLGADAELFIARYGIESRGNAPVDPQGEFEGKNILYESKTLEQLALQFGMTPARALEKLEWATQRLLEARAARPRPHLDDKILTSWNGLMISALSKAHVALDEPAYLSASINAADFIAQRLYDRSSRQLWHRFRDGEGAISGMADDYVFLTQGLLDLYQASLDPRWLEWAMELMDEAIKRFADPGGGLFFTAEGHDPSLLARVMDDTDNVEPCASSVGACNALRLAELCERPAWREFALKTLDRFGELLEQRPMSLAQMLVALDWAHGQPSRVVIAGQAGDEKAAKLIAACRARFLPHLQLMMVDERNRPMLARCAPFAAGLPGGPAPLAFACAGNACRPPISDPAELQRILATP